MISLIDHIIDPSVLVTLEVAKDALQDVSHLLLRGRVKRLIATSASTKVCASWVGRSVVSEQFRKSITSRSLLAAPQLVNQGLERCCRSLRHAAGLVNALLADYCLSHGLLHLNQVLVA